MSAYQELKTQIVQYIEEVKDDYHSARELRTVIEEYARTELKLPAEISNNLFLELCFDGILGPRQKVSKFRLSRQVEDVITEELNVPRTPKKRKDMVEKREAARKLPETLNMEAPSKPRLSEIAFGTLSKDIEIGLKAPLDALSYKIRRTFRNW